MAFWWVSQNQTFRHERAGGYLWAPLADKQGRTPHHWQSMNEVRPGDIIFSFVNQAIRSISVAQTAALGATRPKEFSDTASLWKQDGLKIDVEYQDIDPPVPVAPVSAELNSLLPEFASN
jgi:hypothetical protein